MDREETLKLLRVGPDAIARWNELRERNEAVPSLSRADLRDAGLCGANLSHADLSDTNLSGADLRGADLRGANLSGANLSRSNLYDVDLRGAHLRGAHLSGANLSGANLRDADLRDAALYHAKLAASHAEGADFTRAWFGDTGIGGNLWGAKGLDAIIHVRASDISIGTMLQFKDELPEAFLRGCGVRDEEIAYFRSVVGSVVRFYSCFISYSTANEEFATRLHNDFQAAGIRCWKWDHDARTGRSLWGEIDQAIRKYDKLVLIASEASLKSPAVNREIERAICQEDAREQQKQAGQRSGSADVLFPVRLDDYIFNGWEHERKVDVTKKVIADARGWDTDPAVYARVRDKLIKDLKPD